ncbi:TadE/TadG family type IV pilus assembly protein [Pseudarthrobacter oxydans]|uniref:TadE/TadG family type IV pilus assembly protein n=1 Tax=Pseudarthrobacter oxydans TaxID=1671 RepID=UPI003D28E75B
MPLFSRDPNPGSLRTRLMVALCLAPGSKEQEPLALPGLPHRGGSRRRREGVHLRESMQRQSRGGHHERGSAVVEFTFLALLLMVPLVYFIITMSQIQGGSFAVVGAADQAAKVYIAQPDPATAQAAAEQAVAIALADFGHQPEGAQVATSCNPADCQAAGSTVTVTVSLTVPLPFLPFNDDFRLSASEVEASSTQLVGRFR